MIVAQQSIKKSCFVDEKNQLHISFVLSDAKDIKLKGPKFSADSEYTILKDSLGHWSVKTPPMPIGFHYFWIEADGKKYLLPEEETYFGYNQNVNGFEVDSKDSLFEAKTKDKGVVENRKLNNFDQESYFIYKPYKFNPKKKYPLLVLLHGAGEDASGWIKQGKIQNIVDNLIAEKKIKPLIIVMINGDVKNQKTYHNLEEETLAELPMIENQLMHQVLPGFQKEFDLTTISIAGLSKGSFQAFKIGSDYPDVFSKVGMFSPVLYSGVVEDGFAKIKTESFRQQSYFLSVGNLEDERFINFKNILEKELSAHNTQFKTYISPETYHEWLTWRRSLYQFLFWINK